MKKVLISFFILVILSVCFYLTYGFTISKNEDKKKLTLWTIQLKPIYEKQINNIIKEFEDNNPNYKVVWVDIPIQEAQKRTLASILSSTPPDIVNLNPDFSSILAQKNALHIFEDEETEQFHPSLINKLKYEDKIYALPFYSTSPVTVYNDEIYTKCIGNGIISTYDELFSISEKLTKCAQTQAFASSLNENDVFAKILNKYDISNFETDEEIQKAKYLYSGFNKMYKQNALPKDVLSINHREVVEKYMSGKTAIIVTGSNFLKTIKQNAPDTFKKTKISAQLTGSNGSFDIALMNLIIPKKSKNIEKALEFCLLLTNKENQMELAKIANVIPANKYTLEDSYFKTCGQDIVEQSRCISVKQLEKINTKVFNEKYKTTINEYINKTLEEILLSKKDSTDLTEKKVKALANSIKNLK